MIERIEMYRLLRKLSMVMFDSFLRDLEHHRQQYESAVNWTIEHYSDNRFMENDNG